MFGLDNFFQLGGQLSAQLFAEEQQNDMQQFNAGEAQHGRDFQERMRATAYQTTVNDLKQAGLNPMLAYHSGASATPSASTASGGTAGAGGFAQSNYSASAVAMSQYDVNQAQAKNIDADTELKRVQTDKERETYPVTIANLKAQTAQAEEHIKLMIVQGVREGSSAANLQQQTQNLRAALPQIEATVNQLKSLTRLNDAQIEQLAKQGGLTVAQTKEIIQRVAANLPAAEAALTNSRTTLNSAAANQAQARGTVYQGFRGEALELIRAIKDAINPLNGLFGGGSVTTYGN